MGIAAAAVKTVRRLGVFFIIFKIWHIQFHCGEAVVMIVLLRTMKNVFGKNASLNKTHSLDNN